MVYSYYPGCTLKTKAKELDFYARKSAEALGFTLEEIGGLAVLRRGLSPGFRRDRNQAVRGQGVNAAKEKGQELVTLCSACHHVLKRVNDDMANVPDIREKANNYLELPESYCGETKVLHFLESLRTG